MSSLHSDLVKDSLLLTKFLPDGIQHTLRKAGSGGGRRRTHQELWQRERSLGCGSFGQVWLERSTSGSPNGRVRALKAIRKDSALPIDYGRELEAAAKFSHDRYVDCFVESYGWFEDDSHVYLSLEYIEHGDLRNFLDNAFSESEACLVATQLVDGLESMHSNGFVHRDLKPANILVAKPGPRWWVKIADFGISKRAEEGSTACRTRIGTEGYCAPEVLGVNTAAAAQRSSTDASYTSAVDMWSLGEVLFRMLAQRPAFRDRFELCRFADARVTLDDQMLLLSEQGLGRECSSFVQKLLVVDPSLRITAQEAALHPWLQTIPCSSSSSSGTSSGTSTPTLPEYDSGKTASGRYHGGMTSNPNEAANEPSNQWSTMGLDASVVQGIPLPVPGTQRFSTRPVAEPPESQSRPYSDWKGHVRSAAGPRGISSSSTVYLPEDGEPTLRQQTASISKSRVRRAAGNANTKEQDAARQTEPRAPSKSRTPSNRTGERKRNDDRPLNKTPERSKASRRADTTNWGAFGIPRSPSSMKDGGKRRTETFKSSTNDTDWLETAKHAMRSSRLSNTSSETVNPRKHPKGHDRKSSTTEFWSDVSLDLSWRTFWIGIDQHAAVPTDLSYWYFCRHLRCSHTVGGRYPCFPDRRACYDHVEEFHRSYDYNNGKEARRRSMLLVIMNSRGQLCVPLQEDMAWDIIEAEDLRKGPRLTQPDWSLTMDERCVLLQRRSQFPKLDEDSADTLLRPSHKQPAAPLKPEGFVTRKPEEPRGSNSGTGKLGTWFNLSKRDHQCDHENCVEADRIFTRREYIRHLVKQHKESARGISDEPIIVPKYRQTAHRNVHRGCTIRCTKCLQVAPCECGPDDILELLRIDPFGERSTKASETSRTGK